MQDGNIHCHIANLSRKKSDGGERSAVATAAYISGKRLRNDRLGGYSTFSIREDVVFSKLMAPAGAPAWATDRESLWNRVEKDAKRKDARLAKTIEASLARDIPAADRAQLLQDFVAPFVKAGIVADIAIHEDGTDHNPHVHIMLTTRRLEPDGFGVKLTGIETRQFVKNVRANWAGITNQYLAKAGSTLRVDHRSYKVRGIDREPGQHQGPNREERAQKREHSARVRAIKQEKEMAHPDRYDRETYPLLAQRDSWPPSDAPSPDMSMQERDEHHRYWQDRQVERATEQAHTPPEYEPDQSMPWYEQARQNARGEAQPSEYQPVDEPELAPAERSPHQIREQEIWVRALEMKPTQAEQDLLQLADRAPPEVSAMIKDQIMDIRMERVRSLDRERRLEELEAQIDPHVREKLAALEIDWEAEPVQGPDRELLHPNELQQAQDELMREMENEQER